jgi:Fungalysin/Thermolysin Propeptide Motif
MKRLRTALGLSTALAMLLTVATGLRPAGASSDLVLFRTLHSLTGIHQWYRQTYAGHPVLGAYYARHLDLAGNLTSVADGRLSVSGTLPSAATVSAAVARRRAEAGASAPADLVVLPGRARLVWAVYTVDGFRTLVDATTGAVIRRTFEGREATGTGRVFDPNPVVTLQDESLTDMGNTNYPALQPAYFTHPLTHMDGTGFLRGDFVDVRGANSRASSADLRFLYGRADDRFEQVMVYYHLTHAQEYIQSLGFNDINNEQQDALADSISVDNSFYSPRLDQIQYGTGGVDDAEDAEVILHEYGHAIQDAQVPGFGTNHDAGSIGEAFGDYWAVTSTEPVSNGFILPCVMDWDSTSYTSTPVHCLRRLDTKLTVADEDGEVHHDGQIWSRALWDIHRRLGREVTDTIVLESQFFFTPDISFRDAALATVRTARTLYGDAAARVARHAFANRGIL